MVEWIRVETVLLVAFAAFAVAVGVHRHEPWRAIVMGTAGWVGYLAAMFWAGTIDSSAPLAVSVGALGTYLVVTAHERWQRKRGGA